MTFRRCSTGKLVLIFFYTQAIDNEDSGSLVKDLNQYSWMRDYVVGSLEAFRKVANIVGDSDRALNKILKDRLFREVRKYFTNQYVRGIFIVQHKILSSNRLFYGVLFSTSMRK